jgi:hypothetical protein
VSIRRDRFVPNLLRGLHAVPVRFPMQGTCQRYRRLLAHSMRAAGGRWGPVRWTSAPRGAADLGIDRRGSAPKPASDAFAPGLPPSEQRSPAGLLYASALAHLAIDPPLHLPPPAASPRQPTL